MQFLRTLLWVLVAVLVAIIATNNWRDVPVDLWSNLRADIKLPVLLGLVFIAGWLPTWLVMRGRIWQLRRRHLLDARPVPPPPAAPDPNDATP